jgi:hypothetical protein
MLVHLLALRSGGSTACDTAGTGARHSGHGSATQRARERDTAGTGARHARLGMAAQAEAGGTVF